MDVLEQLNLSEKIYQRIDHLAVAVKDLEQAIFFYRDVLGFGLAERRETRGDKTGMLSAVMDGGEFTIVLLQGTEPTSQVSQFVSQYGPGVQHVALEVKNLEIAIELLKDKGLEFATTIIVGPGLKQSFTRRDSNSGMMVELIERTGNEGFAENSVQDLFNQLEAAQLT